MPVLGSLTAMPLEWHFLDHLPKGTVTSTNNIVSRLHFRAEHYTSRYSYTLSPQSLVKYLPYFHFMDEETILGTLSNLVQVI